MFDYYIHMTAHRIRAVLDEQDVVEPAAHARGLLGPAGEALTVDPVVVARRLEGMVTTTGEPLFPHVNAQAVAEDEDFLAWQRSAWWRALEPGPELAYEVSRESLTELPADGLVEVVKAQARLVAHHEALLTEALAELAARPEYTRCGDSAGHEHDPVKVAASEVSLALSWTPRHADAKVREAVVLAQLLPATLDALRDGRIDGYRARVICEETAPLDEDPEQRLAVERTALGVAERKTGPALRTFVRREVLRRMPGVAELRRQRAREGRRFSEPFVLPDGMAQLQLLGPVEDIAALFTAVDAAARARRDAAAKTTAAGDVVHPDAGVSLSALRFDVLASTAWTALDAGHLGCCAADCSGGAQRLGSRHGRAATVNVTVPFTTLIGIDDEPGILHGYGLVHPVVARRIAAEGTWRRVLTDPASGQVLDYGTTRYVPPQHLADHVIARDVACRFPTCNWTAAACQLDHTVSYRPDGSGGLTSHDNLGPLHDRHHHDKTHHGFGLVQPSPGTFVITTPAGFTYHVDPEAVGPIIDLSPDESGTDPPRSDRNHDLGDDPPDEPPF